MLCTAFEDLGPHFHAPTHNPNFISPFCKIRCQITLSIIQRGKKLFIINVCSILTRMDEGILKISTRSSTESLIKFFYHLTSPGFFRFDIFSATSNPELNVGFGPCHCPILPNLGPVRPGSGSNLSSQPNYGSTKKVLKVDYTNSKSRQYYRTYLHSILMK